MNKRWWIVGLGIIIIITISLVGIYLNRYWSDTNQIEHIEEDYLDKDESDFEFVQNPSRETEEDHEIIREVDSINEEFFEYLEEHAPEIDIERVVQNADSIFPFEILEYGDKSTLMPYLLLPKDSQSCILAYVYPLDDGLGLDDVVWINYNPPKNEIMFEIINESEQIIEYPYADDAKIYIILDGTNVYYSIKTEALSKYIGRYHNLFNVYLENGEIIRIINSYVP